MSDKRIEGIEATLDSHACELTNNEVKIADLDRRHGSQRILKFFEYKHLPEKLQEISKEFHRLAWHLANTVPHGPELTVALRKLLESKDAAVRAAL